MRGLQVMAVLPLVRINTRSPSLHSLILRFLRFFLQRGCGCEGIAYSEKNIPKNESSRKDGYAIAI